MVVPSEKQCDSSLTASGWDGWMSGKEGGGWKGCTGTPHHRLWCALAPPGCLTFWCWESANYQLELVCGTRKRHAGSALSQSSSVCALISGTVGHPFGESQANGLSLQPPPAWTLLFYHGTILGSHIAFSFRSLRFHRQRNYDFEDQIVEQLSHQQDRVTWWFLPRVLIWNSQSP